MSTKKVDIRPGVSVLAVLRHLNYKPWYALAEFVDNSVESFARNQNSLRAHHGEDFKLRVSIDIDTSVPARISIRDNAGGIALEDFSRAFRPAAIPPDRSGLAEFGMGMKSAACWFAPQWHVRTSAFGDNVVRTVNFEIANIVNDEIEELDIHEEGEDAGRHYTEIVLENIFHVPVGRTLGKLKEHLTDIYRVFIREGTLELRFGGEVLTPSEPPILSAPYFREKESPPRLWRKDVAFDFGDGLSVHGFAALRETANTAKAGFALFRRGRVIEGSGDEGYRPAQIFGSSNSYRYQRLFGELHLDGFEVSHTKDGFRWDENEQPFLELLREHLDSEDLPLLKQAEGYRVRVARAQLASTATQAVNNTARTMAERLPAALPPISEAPPVEDIPDEELPHARTLARKQFKVRFRDKDWDINVELTDDPAESQWLVFSDVAASTEQPRNLDIRVSMVHPFMVRFAQRDKEDVEALLRVAAALALSEVLARDSGVRKAGTIRRNLNDIIRDAFSDA
ncbi:ATP-binding protein [Alphaproteobacteria bacterium GH1-50]|uniref:ATP-binding protein n=1 Tax=Kangsaoukella pontilimi TaxID=2691042 RepID=A0A7C9MR53_9RHOB|nr:ATP-binding protein [Kangsaoukella pontilimi]